MLVWQGACMYALVAPSSKYLGLLLAAVQQLFWHPRPQRSALSCSAHICAPRSSDRIVSGWRKKSVQGSGQEGVWGQGSAGTWQAI